MIQKAISLSLLAALATPVLAQGDSTARYEVRIDATWSNATHPGAYPGGAHFSPMIGATHKASGRLWQPGQLASNGIESMAETGSTNSLSAEINALRSSGDADIRITFSPPSTPGVTTFQFNVTEEFPLVSLVTMIAPSPDWFVGVDSLSLVENGCWVDRTVPLPAWDSGTDSGSNFTSGNQNTNPAQPISLITGGPFSGNDPLGSITFRRIGLGSTVCDPAMANSTGLPATITALGTGQAGDALTLVAEQMPANQFGYFLVSTGTGFSMPVGSNGTLCLGGNIGRFNALSQIRNSGGDGLFHLVADTNALPLNPTTVAMPGQTYYFQCWFRENGGVSNFTHAVGVTFQ